MEATSVLDSEQKCTCNDPPPISVPKTKKVSKAASIRANLIFPVGRIRNLIKKLVHPSKVGIHAAVYITAALEYTIMELIKQSIEEAKTLKRFRLTRYHLSRAIHHNPGFANVFQIAAPEAFDEHKIVTARKRPVSTIGPVVAIKPIKRIEPVEGKVKRSSTRKRKKDSQPRAKTGRKKPKTNKNIEPQSLVPVGMGEMSHGPINQNELLISFPVRDSELQIQTSEKETAPTPSLDMLLGDYDI